MMIFKLIRSVFLMTRFSNLVIICITGFLIRHTIINPFLQSDGTASSIDDLAFVMLILATVIIAAGGYIINDFFDVKIDAINKPGKNLIGNSISKNTAIMLYIFLTLSGIIISYNFGEMIGLRYPILVFALCAGLLYFYSSSYKTMLIIGNFIISLLAALSIFITILFDHNALKSPHVLTVITAYATFAFLMTFTREIIKDCEDAMGDRTYNATTLPLVIGVNPTRIIAGLLALTVFSLVLWIQIIQSQWETLLPFLYVTLFIQLPLLVLAFRCFTSNSKKADRRNSTISKSIMLTGILSMLVFHLLF